MVDAQTATGALFNEANISLLGVVSAPLWNSEKSVFAGMFTVSDIIHLIQYYYHTSSYDNATTDVETFRLESLRGTSTRSPSATGKIDDASLDIEKSLGVATPPLIHEHPNASLYDASQRLIQTHARRLPLLDNDSETGHQVIVSVLTQYRLLKFISINVRVLVPETAMTFTHLARYSVHEIFNLSIFLFANSESVHMSSVTSRTESSNQGKIRITPLRLPR
jgi:hypothetical protein